MSIVSMIKSIEHTQRQRHSVQVKQNPSEDKISTPCPHCPLGHGDTEKPELGKFLSNH